MNIAEVLLLALGLAMDAFAVSVCKGLALHRITLRNALTVGLWFGGFQALMPLIGYFLGSRFESYIRSFDHWIAFILLTLIGANMLRESFSGGGEDECSASVSPKAMLLPAVATSIDALAVGVALAMVSERSVNIWTSVACIGIVTLALSAIGVKIGSVFGGRFKGMAERTGGIILIIIGIKIVLEHLGVLPY